MSLSSQDPDQLLTTAQIDVWLRTATVKRLELHLRATDPFNTVRAQAFWEMGQLCKEAIEEVRVMSAQLIEESQAVRVRSAAILAESVRLLAQYTPLTEPQIRQLLSGE